jgi:hypothetical protein
MIGAKDSRSLAGRMRRKEFLEISLATSGVCATARCLIIALYLPYLRP